MREVVFTVVVLIYVACAYLAGYLIARNWFHEAVLRPWLDWRGDQLEKARSLSGDEWRAWLVKFEADKAAYEALTNVLYPKLLPWQKTPKYTREDSSDAK